jgi:hypothetical protein
MRTGSGSLSLFWGGNRWWGRVSGNWWEKFCQRHLSDLGYLFSDKSTCLGTLFLELFSAKLWCTCVKVLVVHLHTLSQIPGGGIISPWCCTRGWSAWWIWLSWFWCRGLTRLGSGTRDGRSWRWMTWSCWQSTIQARSRRLLWLCWLRWWLRWCCWCRRSWSSRSRGSTDRLSQWLKPGNWGPVILKFRYHVWFSC